MRPTKNRVYCYGCQRSKMLFESKAKADNFIAYNSEGILEENGKAPVRSYYCGLCGGYHVTSNPSIVAGESLNQRDQMLVNKLDVYKKVMQDYQKFHDDMSQRIEKAKRQMYLGNIQDIISLADEFQIDSETLLNLPIKTRSKCMTLRQRVEMYSDIASQMMSILKLPQEEIVEKIKFENPTRREELLAKMVNSSIVIKEYEEQFEHIEQLMHDEKWEDAKKILAVLKEKLAAQKGPSVLKEITNNYQQKLDKISRYISEKKKSIKKENLIEEKLNEELKSEKDVAAYKSAILNVIERIEKVKQAFEQNDMDTCENELEIAEFLMDDFSFEDDNTKLLRSQIDMWKEKIAEGNE